METFQSFETLSFTPIYVKHLDIFMYFSYFIGRKRDAEQHL